MQENYYVQAHAKPILQQTKPVQESPRVARKGRRYRLYSKASGRGRKRFSIVTTFLCTFWWCCYIERRNQRQDTIWCDGCMLQLCRRTS